MQDEMLELQQRNQMNDRSMSTAAKEEVREEKNQMLNSDKLNSLRSSP